MISGELNRETLRLGDACILCPFRHTHAVTGDTPFKILSGDENQPPASRNTEKSRKKIDAICCSSMHPT